MPAVEQLANLTMTLKGLENQAYSKPEFPIYMYAI